MTVSEERAWSMAKAVSDPDRHCTWFSHPRMGPSLSKHGSTCILGRLAHFMHMLGSLTWVGHQHHGEDTIGSNCLVLDVSDRSSQQRCCIYL